MTDSDRERTTETFSAGMPFSLPRMAFTAIRMVEETSETTSLEWVSR